MAPVSAKSGGSVSALAALLRRRPKLWLVGAAILLVLLLYPFVIGGIVAHLAAGRIGARLGRPVTIAQGRGGLGRFVLRGFVVEGAAGKSEAPPLVAADEIAIPFSAAWGGSPITVVGLRVNAVRGGDGDNVSDIVARLRGKRTEGESPPASSSGSSSSLPGIRVESGTIDVQDFESGLALKIAGIAGLLAPGRQASVRLRGVSGLLALGGGDKGPRFGATELDVRTALKSGLHPQGYPMVRVQDGFATPLPTLALTGITGTVGPPPTAAGAPSDDGRGVVIDLHGSYGGARESLWTAKGTAQPANREGRLSLRAAQFSLDKIADVLPRSVLSPARSNIDAAFDLTWAGESVRFGGDMAVTGLSLQHDALSSEPIEGMSLGLVLRGVAYPQRRRVELELLEGRLRNLVARITGSVELPRGKYVFSDGSHLSMVPKIDLALTVPRLPCAKLLASVPAALTPRLQGFVLQGNFEALVGTKIDFADLESLDLRGKVGINGCKVVKAPEAVVALRDGEPIVMTVEVPQPPGPGMAPGETETMQFVVGPDNPDFTPYAEISPYLIGSIMTTEDNGFFKHHGWVTSQFKGALKRNLERGGFRIGASSITMQMVKNVLLSQEKTLSRKLQELFLVWYLEQVLPKERILELYFNAIEFGPRIYGIGAAARHYFGKRPSELTPLEGAFFSSMLPNPKRRYIQYCHGAPYPPWDKYVRRILATVHQRGHITDEEYEQAASQPLVFDRHEATFTEKQCLDWVKKMTTRPEPESPPELDAGDEPPSEGPEIHAPVPKHGKHRRGGARGPRGAMVNTDETPRAARGARR